MTQVSTDRRFGINAGAAIKVPVKAATTANVTLSGEQTIDGISCVTDDRVLVQNQTTASENGIYTVDTGDWSRAADFNGVYDVVEGTIIPVNRGTTYGIRGRRITNTGTITLGTTSLTFGDTLYSSSAGIEFVQSGTGAIAGSLQGRGRLTVSIYDFMTDAQRADALLAAPVLDHASAMSAAVARIMGTQGSIATRGGAIHIPGGYRIRLATDPFGVLPNDGVSVPTQVPLRIFGDGPDTHTTGTIAFTGGSVIDFRYTTANNAKIDTRGRGVLEMDHLVIADESGNAEAFVHTTNTCLLIHDNLFIGSKTSAWDQDCVILGGTSTTIDGTSDAPFQGYGSLIYNNHFHRIRRAVYARVYANGVPVFHNTVWNDCGFSTGAPFTYDADPLTDPPGQGISGVPCHHNLVEEVNYKYGVMLRGVSSSTLGPNDFYDPTATTTAHYLVAQGTFNTIIAGHHSDAKTFVSESATAPSAVNSNTWINGHQAQESVFGAYARFKSNVQFDNVTLATAGTAVVGIIAAKASLDFTAIAAQASEEFDITVTGARQGDMVAIGMLNAQATLGAAAPTTYFAWVRANDTVRLRRSNVGTVAAADPAAGDVGVVVIKMNI